MTVQEVMAAMIGAYRGFDSSAVTAMASVFQQKLEKYEGPELRNAWIEVAASFRRTAATPYPMPSDFENVLPRAAKIKGGPALDREAHGRRKAELLDDWRQWQQPEISQAFGPRVAFWCESEVRSIADTVAWIKGDDGPQKIVLLDKEIARIFESVVSRDRMDTFGMVSHPETWRAQFEQCRTHVVAGRYSRNEIALPVSEKSTGKILVNIPPTVDLRPEEWQPGEPPGWLDDGAPPPDPI